MLDATDMAWPFDELLSCLARGRPLQAGTIVGSGIWRHPAQLVNGESTWPRGHGCLAHRRDAEKRLHGQTISHFLTWGDEVRIDMKGTDGMSVCGAIHRVVRSAG
jgi:fumarylacetoacetate (FAA) hydrolase